MLSRVLRSKIAIDTSIRIINTFVAMRKYISNNLIGQNYINDLVFNHEERLKVVEDTFSKFKAKKNIIIIIDNYIDKKNIISLRCII